MLVLTRKANESVVIICPDGTPLRISVADIRSVRARLAIDAPKEYRIHRGELLPDAPADPMGAPSLTPIPEAA